MKTHDVTAIFPLRFRPYVLVLATLLLLGPSLAGAAGPAGSFLASVNDVPVSIETNNGVQTSNADLTFVLAVIGNSGVRTVSVRDFDLTSPGVTTTIGATGTLTGSLKASAKPPQTGDGRLNLALALSVHYPLIDRIFPPSPQPYLETFGGKLTGTLTYDPGAATYHLDGILHLSVKGAATGKVLSLDLPLDNIALQPDGREAGLYPTRDRQPQVGVWRSSLAWVRSL